MGPTKKVVTKSPPKATSKRSAQTAPPKSAAKSTKSDKPAVKKQPTTKSSVQVVKTSKIVSAKPAASKAQAPMPKTAAVTKTAEKKAPVKAPKTVAKAQPKVAAPATPANAANAAAPAAPAAKVPAAVAVAPAKAPVAAGAAAKPAVAPGLPKAIVPPQVTPRQAPPVQRAMPSAVSKPAQTKLTAPAASSVASAQAAAAAAAAKKPVSSRHGFKTNESVVYPAHGVGRIVGIEEQEIAGITLELFVIQFEKDKMTLRVPTSKLASVGMRKLAEDGIVRKAMETLKGKARIKRTMWSRRAQEYEAKINSGDLVAIAEVVRDLYRSEAQPEQSYSERQLYEAALDRMAREIAAVDKVDERGAMQRITEVLSKSAKGRRAAEDEAAAEEAAGAEVKAA